MKVVEFRRNIESCEKLCCFENLIKVLHSEKSTWLIEEELAAGENWQETSRRRLKFRNCAQI